MNVVKKCGSQKKYFLTDFWQSTNIFNIMGGFGRYDHVTKELIDFGHVETKVHSRRSLYIFKKLINIQQSLCPIRCSGFVMRKAFYTT